jgi:hypothetical protein
MQRKIPVLVPQLFKLSLFYRSFSSSTNKVLTVQLTPELPREAKVVIPVSMIRYERNREEFDRELSELFQHTASQLAMDKIESVHVIATTALHENWSKDKIAQVDNHFLKTHKKILERQTGFFLWDEWINQHGKDVHEEYYQEILGLSKEESEWYKLMVKTHSQVAASENLETSLKYQRQEYAAIRLMASYYTDLVYMGRISPAWSYLYEAYPRLPRFVKAIIKAPLRQVKKFDSSFAVENILMQVENVVSSPNFPPNEKEKLIDVCQALFRTYGPKPKHLFIKSERALEIEKEMPSLLPGMKLQRL